MTARPKKVERRDSWFVLVEGKDDCEHRRFVRSVSPPGVACRDCGRRLAEQWPEPDRLEL